MIAPPPRGRKAHEGLVLRQVEEHVQVDRGRNERHGILAHLVHVDCKRAHPSPVPGVLQKARDEGGRAEVGDEVVLDVRPVDDAHAVDAPVPDVSHLGGREPRLHALREPSLAVRGRELHGHMVVHEIRVAGAAGRVEPGAGAHAAVVEGVELHREPVADARVAEPRAPGPQRGRGVGVPVKHKGEAVPAADAAGAVRGGAEAPVLDVRARLAVVRHLEGEASLEAVEHRRGADAHDASDAKGARRGQAQPQTASLRVRRPPLLVAVRKAREKGRGIPRVVQRVGCARLVAGHVDALLHPAGEAAPVARVVAAVRAVVLVRPAVVAARGRRVAIVRQARRLVEVRVEEVGRRRARQQDEQGEEEGDGEEAKRSATVSCASHQSTARSRRQRPGLGGVWQDTRIHGSHGAEAARRDRAPVLDSLR